MVEIEGKICEKTVFILIDPSSSLSYASPFIVYLRKLERIKHQKSWLVQLATSTKRRVRKLVPHCLLNINSMEQKQN